MKNKVVEAVSHFQQRKRDHIKQALDETNQAQGLSGLDTIELIHEALPELDFHDVDISTSVLNIPLPSPFYVASMTAGHHDAIQINERLAIATASQGWLMGVGSQRRQLFDKSAIDEWQQIKKTAPQAKLVGNIGLTQAIASSSKDIQNLIDSIAAVALFIHLNPLQEVIQTEGTPYFKNGLKTIERLCRDLSVPVIIKETGCGFSKNTLQRLQNVGIFAVDISGFGGTHWGRIEGKRSDNSLHVQTAETFKNWGIATLDCLLNARTLNLDYQIFASGGIRSGLDAAKCLTLGASMVGFAKPILEAALKSTEEVIQLMQRIEYELKVALFCTGSINIQALQTNACWRNKYEQ